MKDTDRPMNTMNPTRLPENVPGEFYVTSECIDCDLCRENAPLVFGRHEGIGLSVVQRQPRTVEERRAAMDALEGCPTEAIRSDGLATIPTNDGSSGNTSIGGEWVHQ